MKSTFPLILGGSFILYYLFSRDGMSGFENDAPYRLNCSRAACNEIESNWGIPKDYLWAIFGVETSYGANITVGTSGERGPMQVLPATELTLVQEYPSVLTGLDLRTCGGGFQFAAAHIAYTAKKRNWSRSDLRNIVAYNQGAFGRDTYGSELLLTNAVAWLKSFKSAGLPLQPLNTGVHYFDKWATEYVKNLR